jgi:hypothetical protein
VDNPPAGAHTRTKHFDVQYDFARQRVMLGEIYACYISTEKMVADVFTKQLGGPMFRMHRLKMGLTHK